MPRASSAPGVSSEVGKIAAEGSGVGKAVTAESGGDVVAVGPPDGAMVRSMGLVAELHDHFDLEGSDGELAQVMLRMPESLRMHVEQIAAAEGISINAWLVRAVTVAVNQQHGPPPVAHGSWSGKRVTGYLPS
ncbi:hypothetical protein FB565_003748 [Actinoplanes lutulentus]|uniref:HicB-like protein involved in pilus formation n=1 Tax=Actinoplanes lutulentus TaxID=1287878 RepID=A0A327ZPU7_9ACTN|nr:hypothetical protein [Actinoplanes lutulentus]MBB2944019.1 hypothetical protein [Actinoplanes lutulentus]RAK42748.1 hypothetical protein B0I29_102574 [Actinoplanes lutulentus]